MKKADKYILLGLALLLIISSLGVYVFKTYFSTPGTMAIITQNGTLIYEIDLNQVKAPYELMVETDQGGANTILVEKDQIQITDGNCPDQLCVKAGILAYTGDIAVCLPHGLFVEIKEGNTGEVDSLSY